ncbi:histidine kinase [Lysobacter sp. KIS68-7]|uniref:sensor histidine kinase n=1 Tax=Lysobacter sp. KIS68-7 TaxID=2904252 RepID=UPI001E2E3620|nr:sensor histidine kinase [Lysobacter sp. KIS68-7]UHQ18803.1 histidine kinase [Lysobacter sp. KIS68-7]
MTLHSAHAIGRSLTWLVAAALTFCSPAWAVDPARQISQYGHVAWRSQDGDLPGMPMAFAQGPDGYLWVGTLDGLLRFDGVRFARWSAPAGTHLPSDAVTRLLATRDGTLWIGTQQGLGQWRDGKLRIFPSTPGGAIMSITEDRDGTIWTTRTPRPDSSALVCRVSPDGKFACLDKAQGLEIPGSPCCPAAFLQDATGTAWIGSDIALTAWRNQASQVFKLPLDSARKDMGVAAIAPRNDGGLWVGIAKPGPGLGLQQFVDGRWTPFTSANFDASTLPVSALLLDRHGALWIGTYGKGLYRIHRGEIDAFTSTDGLSNDRINGLFEDREGNLWVATAKGIDQFRDLRVTTFSKQQGLSSDSAASIAAANDGSIWIGSAGLDVLRDGRISSLTKSLGLPDGQVTDLLQDHAGRMWVGVDRSLWIIDRGKAVQVHARDGTTNIASIASLAEDAQHDLWGRSKDSLLRIRDNVVIDAYPLGPELEGRQIVADPASGIWLGLRSGDLARFRDGKAQTFAFARPPEASVNGFVEHMATTSLGEVFGATANGVVAWKDGHTNTLTTANGLPCNHAHALQSARDGRLWVFMQCGLVEIARAEIDRWWTQPQTRLQIRQYDALDGVDPGWAPFRGATTSPDGRIWFANGHGVQMIDPAATTRNRIAPSVHIESLVVDRTRYPLHGAVQLPARAGDVQIDYTATSFVVPQRVRFRYKLAGRDKDWQEPGTRRQAFYTDLQPGNYRFTVIAANDDGVWNTRGDSLSFRIPPAWYQTLWFRVGAIALCLLGAWLAYRWRLRRLTATMSARFDERMAERLRIARELHDTLLQTVQAGKLVADDALGPDVEDARRKHALERISAWLGEAIGEGRETLNALRQSTLLDNDLANGLQQAAEACAGESGMVVRVSVTGRAREMHPIVRDEIYRIGYEAIRNAASHSHGRTIEVELAYARDLTLVVRDDGSGIPSAEVAQGKAGHFGMQGMRERAERIGARLFVARGPTGGTEVRVLVPGRSIFR